MFKFWLPRELDPASLALLGPHGEFIGPVFHPDPTDPLAELELADAAIVTTAFPGSPASFARAGNLKVLAQCGSGYDNLDLDAATANGICLVNTAGSATESTAEFTVALILAVARRIRPMDRAIRSGYWPLPVERMGLELAEKRLGIVGFGRVGQRVAEIALAFHMKVAAYDPMPESSRAVELGVDLLPDLITLLAQSDVVTLHVPMTEATRDLIGPRELSAMRPGALLIQTARGGVVIEHALTEALRSGHLAGAAIDVWDPEPPRNDNPLLQMDNVIVTPHMASITPGARERSNRSAGEQVLMVLQGKRPPRLLNPEVWERRRR